MIDLDNTNIKKPRHPVGAAVDDEEMVTISIKSYLELETDYRVLTFQSSVEALKTQNISIEYCNFRLFNAGDGWIAILFSDGSYCGKR